jgi:hypothetical protein
MSGSTLLEFGLPLNELRHLLDFVRGRGAPLLAAAPPKTPSIIDASSSFQISSVLDWTNKIFVPRPEAVEADEPAKL